MQAANFFSELKRRQIYRGGVMYVVAGWVIVQVSTTLFPIFSIPSWAIRLVVVAIILGFPLALVALWMFESSAGPQAGAAAPPPGPPVERRRNADRSGEAIAQIMESERLERQRANEELIAALDRLHKTQHNGPAHAAHAAHEAHEDTALQEPTPQAPLPPIAPARGRRGLGSLFILLFALALAAWIIWTLVAPSMPAGGMDADQLSQRFVLPAYRQVEEIGAGLLAPLLRKLGIGIAPDRVFTTLMMLVALLVLRNLYRSMSRNRRLRRQRA
jgi:hypothetical protein